VAVAQRLGVEGADHLRVAVVATLFHVHIATGQLQRRVGLEALHRLRGGLLEEQRHDLDQPADRDHQNDEHDHQEVVGLDPLVGETFGRFVVDWPCCLTPQAWATAAGILTGALHQS
jgi:hypothetical protein